ncbi:MAG: arsenic resistance protein [Rothia sp. (in: high G+C Gram-positive bacteria)]|nr:arsenic resistance protein [Rothia sp. (in: high G+C Gram-positive bacteria)]
MAAFLEKHQVMLYLLALLAGGAASFLPGLDHLANPLVSPALALLLLATFLSIPLRQATVRHLPQRFLTSLVLLNFLLVPIIAAALLALTPLPDAVAFTAALVLLSPCIDYVVVFTRLAGGSAHRLLAATPVLLAAQLLLAPLWLAIFTRLDLWQNTPVDLTALYLEVGPALSALLVVLLALALAWALQNNRATQERAGQLAEISMVPLMLAVLFLTSSAHTHTLSGGWQTLAPLLPLYITFAALAGLSSWLLSRYLLGGAAPAANHANRISLTFSAVTRNALVVLPIVLGISHIALKAGVPAADLMPMTVVTQTLVELLVMTAMVALLRAQKTGHLAVRNN